MAVVHRIYAQALVEAARASGELEPVREEFGDLAAALEASPELRSLLRNPQVDARAKGEALAAALGEASGTFRNFVRLLAEKNRIDQLEEVHHEFERRLAAEERLLELDLTTAVELSDAEADGIVRQIEQAAGRRVVATRSVDPALIGGLVLRAGSRRVDASVRGRLEQLRHELTTRS